MDSKKLLDAVMDLLSNICSGRFEECSIQSNAEFASFEAVVIAESEEGEVQSGWLGGVILQWWLLGENGCRSVNYRGLPAFVIGMNQAEASGASTYRHLLVRFHRQQSRIVFGAAIGPHVTWRYVGWLSDSKDGDKVIELRQVW
jgi:hypothetical protein